MTYLATQPPGKLSGTREISSSESIPSSFLCKVLLQLRRGRLLRSYKGIRGGYELAMPPDKISLLMIVRCIEGEEAFAGCVLDDKYCTPEHPCSLHESWIGIRDQLMGLLDHKTLADLVLKRQAELRTGAQPTGPAGIIRLLDQ